MQPCLMKEACSLPPPLSIALFTCQCHHTPPGLPSPQRLYLSVSITIHHPTPQKKLYLPINVTIHHLGSPSHKGSIYLSVSPYTTRAPLPPKALFTCQCHHTPPGLPSPKGSIYLSVSPYITRASLPPKALFTCQCHHTPPRLPSPEKALFTCQCHHTLLGFPSP